MYRKYGHECVKYFNGMFSFALWDKDNKYRELTSSEIILPKHSDKESLVVPTQGSIDANKVFKAWSNSSNLCIFNNVTLQVREGTVHFINSSLFVFDVL